MSEEEKQLEKLEHGREEFIAMMRAYQSDNTISSWTYEEFQKRMDRVRNIKRKLWDLAWRIGHDRLVYEKEMDSLINEIRAKFERFESEMLQKYREKMGWFGTPERNEAPITNRAPSLSSAVVVPDRSRYVAGGAVPKRLGCLDASNNNIDISEREQRRERKPSEDRRGRSRDRSVPDNEERIVRTEGRRLVVTKAPSTKRETDNSRDCFACGQDHWVTNCRAFAELDLDSRWAVANVKYVCLHCFRKSHRTENCLVWHDGHPVRPSGCGRCNGELHNSLLCPNNPRNI